MSHCPNCKKLMRGICRYCQPQEYIDMQGRAFTDLMNDMKQRQAQKQNKPNRIINEMIVTGKGDEKFFADRWSQRQWVGLDNDDLVWIYSNSDKIGQAISNTEAKLKEKNCL